MFDINDTFKNVPLANAIQHMSEDEYSVKLDDMLDDETGMYLKDEDPSLTLPEDRLQLYGELRSDLVDLAATFQDALGEDTVHGIMERLREITATKAEFKGKAGCEEDVEVAQMADTLVKNMEKRSPLALSVTHELLKRGSVHGETPETCMDREAAAQAKLFGKANGDFVRWAESGAGVGLVEMPLGNTSLIREREDTYKGGWAHKGVKEVSRD